MAEIRRYWYGGVDVAAPSDGAAVEAGGVADHAGAPGEQCIRGLVGEVEESDGESTWASGLGTGGTGDDY